MPESNHVLAINHSFKELEMDDAKVCECKYTDETIRCICRENTIISLFPTKILTINRVWRVSHASRIFSSSLQVVFWPFCVENFGGSDVGGSVEDSNEPAWDFGITYFTAVRVKSAKVR